MKLLDKFVVYDTRKYFFTLEFFYLIIQLYFCRSGCVAIPKVWGGPQRLKCKLTHTLHLIFINLIFSIMSNKLFKSIFAVAMVLGAAFGFASCVPQDEPAATDPKVEVSKTALTFSIAEGSDTLDVTATAGWKTEVAVDWVTVAPATGNGSKTITVSVSANDTDAKRETVLKVHAINAAYGDWDTEEATIIK